MFDQVKQAMQMRKEAKKIQSEIEKITFSYENGGITCVARGDFTIVSLNISEDTFNEVVSGKREKFNTMLNNVINGALKGVKKATQDQMAKMMQANGGLENMFGA